MTKILRDFTQFLHLNAGIIPWNISSQIASSQSWTTEKV